MYSVVIVGGAFAGTSTLVHLWERLAPRIESGQLHLTMYERDSELGKGLAWDGRMVSNCQLSNLPAERLRLSDSFRPSFVQWLAAAYPPRHYFGEYVQAVCEQLRDAPNTDIRSGTEAVKIERAGPNRGGQLFVTVHGPSGEFCQEADCVIVCTGSPTTGGGTRFPHLTGAPGYLHTPWPATGITQALRGATRVAVIGSGLTAVDVIKHIDQCSPGVPMLVASRQGRFNVVARDLRRPEIAGQPDYKRSVLTDEVLAALPQHCSLAQCLELIRSEIEASLNGQPVDWKRLMSSDVDGVEEWRSHAQAHRAGAPCRWQLALLAIEDVFPELWRRLGDEDRSRWYASNTKTVFQNYTNPLPIESAEQVLRLIDNERVEVRDQLRSVKSLPQGGFRLRFSGEAHGGRPDVDVSHCINCTGVGYDVKQDPSPLMRQLLADGIARPDPFGGLEIDPDSFRVRGHDNECPNLFVVGHHAKGVRYLTSGIGFILSMINTVVSTIEDQVRSGSDCGQGR